MLLQGLCVLGVVAAAPYVARDEDPCAKLSSLSNDNWYVPSEVKACMQTIPFSAQDRDSILDWFSVNYAASPFNHDHGHGTGGRLAIELDLWAWIDSAKTKNYTSDWAFHLDLYDQVNRLNDGHYSYSMCYPWTSVVGLPLTSWKTDAETGIYFVDDLEAQASSLSSRYTAAGVNVSSLAGAQVHSIDGQDVWEYLDSVKLPRTGHYQDPNLRLNRLLASPRADGNVYSSFAGYFGTDYDYDRDNVTFGISTAAGEINVTVPILMRYGDMFDDVRYAWNHTSGSDAFQSCLVSESKRSNEALDQDQELDRQVTQLISSYAGRGTVNMTSYRGEVQRACPIVTAGGISDQPYASEYYLGGKDVMFYRLDNATGVMVFSTVSPTDKCLNRFMVDLVDGVRNLTSAGVQRLLIDTSNNGGGSIKLAMFVQRVLIGAEYDLENNFGSYLVKNDLSIKIDQKQSGVFLKTQYRAHNSTQAYTAGSIMDPGTTKVIAGTSYDYSDELYLSLDYASALVNFFNLSSAAPFPKGSIVFTGNGLCGSSCSIVTNGLIEYFGAQGVVTNPRPDRTIEFQGFAGGLVTSDALLAVAAQTANVTTPTIRTRNDLSYPIRGAVTQSGEWVQFRSFPAKWSFSPTKEQRDSPVELWKAAAAEAWGA